MSRAGLYGSLLAAVAAVLVVSCAGGEQQLTVNTAGSLRVHFTCGGATNTYGLAGENGQGAWKAARNRGERIGWTVPNNVMINSIRLKDGGAIPVKVDQPPTRPGMPLEGTVEGEPRTYQYNIDVTCRQNGDSVRLIIDPEMIVR
jgi:hypothetical protein